MCQEQVNHSLEDVDKGIAHPDCKNTYTEGHNKAANAGHKAAAAKRPHFANGWRKPSLIGLLSCNVKRNHK